MTSNVFPAIIKATYDPSGGFPKMVQDAQRASGQIRKQFESDLTSIKQLSDTALSVPRNAGGSLDLGVAEYRRAADAAKAHAIALREIATAAASAAKSSGDTSRSTQTYVQAARAAAREAEQQAVSVNNTAIAHERLQAELNKTKSATDAVVSAQNRGTTAYRQSGESLRGMRQATIQSAQQIQDLGISLYSGQRASTVFAQQLPQLAFALTSLEGNTNKTLNRIGAFAAFLSGPLWSVALVGASIGLGVLVEKLFQSEKAADKAADAHQTLADKLNLQKNSYDKVIQASREYNAEQAKSRELTLASAEAAAIQAKKNIEAAISIRQKLAAELAAANQTALNSAGQGFGGATSSAVGRAAGLEAQIRANTAELGTLEQTARNTVVSVAEELAKINTDPQYAIEVRFDRLRESAKNSIKDVNSLRVELEKLNRQEKSALDAQKESSRSVSGLPKVTDTEVAGLLGFGPGQFGGRRSASRNKNVGGAKNSYHLSGQAIDIPLTLNGRPLTKEGIRAELESAGVIIKELLGPGDKGHDDHFHVAFSKTRGGPDQIEARREREREKAARETERLARISDSAAESIARINEQYDEQPRLVDQSARAVRRLQDILSELNKPENANTPRLAELKRDAEAAIATAQKAVSTDFDRQTESFQDRLQIQRLILAGREDEAAIAERLAQIEERYGTGKRLEFLKEELKAANEILAAEDSTQAEREKAQATIKDNTKEYDTLSALVARIRRETTEQYGLEKAINEAIEKRNDSIARYQSVVSGVYGSLEDLLSGGNAGDFFKSLKEQFNQLRGQNLAESLFGDAFRQLKDFTERNNPQNIAVNRLIETTDKSSTALSGFVDTLLDQTSRLTGAANDNPSGSAAPSVADGIAEQDLIVVTGSIKKAIVDGNRYSFGTFASATAASIVNPLLAKLDDAFGVKFFGQLSGALTGALAGFARAGKVGGALGFGQGLFDTLSKNTKISEKSAASLSKISGKFGQGLGGAQTGDQTAQLLRSFGVKTSRTGGQIGGAIGSFLPIPGGEIIGSIIGSVVGGLFKKTKKGSTTISNLTDDLAFTGSGKLKDSTLGLGNNVKASLSNIIEQLGGTAGSFSVSVGQRGKNFVVDPSGSGKTKGSGVLKFKTEEEAARAALLDAIKDGAVQGIKAGAQRLLQAGNDLDAQLQKAIKFQSVFDRLEAIKNPLGSAINTLNREFTGLISIFKEAGASAEEFASLEELYGLERQRIIEQQSQELTSSLRALIDELKQGDNGLALRDRLANIRSQFDPLANTIRGGGVVDYDRFSELARQLIDVQRQISGSQVDYFAVFNEILGLSEQALAGQQNVISIGSGANSPFSGSAAPSNASTPVVGAINSQTTTLMGGLAALQAQVANLNFAPSRLSTANGFSLGGSTYF